MRTVGCLLLGSLLLSSCGDEDCADTGAPTPSLEVGLSHFVEDGAWSYSLDWGTGSALCSYVAPLDSTEVPCEGAVEAVVTVNGTVHTLSSMVLDEAPEAVVFEATYEGLRQHEQTLEPGYQIVKVDEACGGGEVRQGQVTVSW